MKGTSEHARALLDLAEVELPPAREEEVVFDFFEPEPISQEEHFENARRVGRLVALIEEAGLWQREGFASRDAYLRFLGVAEEVIRLLPPCPATVPARPTSGKWSAK